MKHIYTVLIPSLFCATTVFSQGTVIHDRFYSPSLGIDKWVDVYLPKGYDQDDTTRRYPVVTYLHGYGGDQNGDEFVIRAANALLGSKQISPVIVVKPDGQHAWYTNTIMFGRYEDFIVYDVMDYIETNYNTMAVRDKRCIMGWSMGGHGALKIAFRYPDLYRASVSHSGAELDFTSIILYWMPFILEEYSGSGPFDPEAGTYPKWMKKMARFDLLILDDFGLTSLTTLQAQELLEIIEERSAQGSHIFTSQLPVKEWYAYFKNPTLADAIMDRIIHNAYRINLKGESMRKLRKPVSISDTLT